MRYGESHACHMSHMRVTCVSTWSHCVSNFPPSPPPSPGLQDPRYTEEKKRQIAEKKTQEEVFAEGVQIGSNLKLLAERRTDIFGMEETFIGQKIGEEAETVKPPRVQWDGHSSRWGGAEVMS